MLCEKIHTKKVSVIGFTAVTFVKEKLGYDDTLMPLAVMVSEEFGE